MDPVELAVAASTLAVNVATLAGMAWHLRRCPGGSGGGTPPVPSRAAAQAAAFAGASAAVFRAVTGRTDDQRHHPQRTRARSGARVPAPVWPWPLTPDRGAWLGDANGTHTCSSSMSTNAAPMTTSGCSSRPSTHSGLWSRRQMSGCRVRQLRAPSLEAWGQQWARISRRGDQGVGCVSRARLGRQAECRR